MERFEIKKVENETLNVFYGDVYTIKDNLDEDSPVKSFRFLKPTAERICDWLNENVKKVETPEEKIHKAMDELWCSDAIRMEKVNNIFYLIERKDTCVTYDDIAYVLDIPEDRIDYISLNSSRSVFIIKRSDLE